MSEEPESRWVVVEMTTAVGSVLSYRGRMAISDIDAWREGRVEGALTLRSAYWIVEDEQGRPSPVIAGRSPKTRQATGVLHLAARLVQLIMEMRGPDPGVSTDPGQVISLGAVRHSEDI